MLQKLFEGVDGLNESVISRMQPIFEAAVNEKVAEQLQIKEAEHATEISDLREQLAEAAAHNVNESAKLLAENLDNFLEMAIADWANKNSVALQHASLSESAQTFLASIAEAAKQYNQVIPESDIDEVARLNEALNLNKSRLDDALNEAAQSRAAMISMKKEKIIAEACEGLSQFSASKLSEKVSGLSFSDEKQFKELVEGYKVVMAANKGLKEDDLFDDGTEKKSKQTKDGKLEEEFVDGTDKDYPLNIKEGEGKEKEEEEEDEKEDEDEEMKEAKKISESAVTRLKKLGLLR